MTSRLEFPEVARAFRRAWVHTVGASVLWVTIIGLAFLSDEDLPFPWYVGIPFGLACYALAWVLAGVLGPIRDGNATEAAGFSAIAPRSPVELRSAAWLKFPLGALPRRWLAPRLAWSADEVVLSSRYASRRVPRSEIDSVRARCDGVDLVLRTGETLALRTAALPSSVLERVHRPLAAALLSARARALDFNQALARELTPG
ncbi:MAG: hypothetical protein IT377_01550 [Polyangiaceae bacterium]|nr:hypothetical protein [Polyangiaceae bacterium]